MIELNVLKIDNIVFNYKLFDINIILSILNILIYFTFLGDFVFCTVIPVQVNKKNIHAYGWKKKLDIQITSLKKKRKSHS